MEKYVFPSFLSLGELNNWIDRKRRRRRRSREEKITKRVSKTRTKGLAGKDSETMDPVNVGGEESSAVGFPRILRFTWSKICFSMETNANDARLG